MNPNSIPKRISSWVLGCFAAVMAAATAHGQLSLTSPGSITINDQARATPYPSTLTVSNMLNSVSTAQSAGGGIQKVTVRINGVSHNYPDDIDAAISGPSVGGTRETVLLWSDAGGQFSLSGADVTFDQSAGALPDEAQINSSSYRPTDYVGTDADTFYGTPPTGPFQLNLNDAYRGDSANGDWSLYVVDDQQLDGGLIRSWTLNVYNRPIIAVTNNVVSGLPQASTTEDNAVTFNFYVNDSDTPLENLILSTDIPGNSSLVEGVSFGGTGTNRTVTITPKANANGTINFSLRVQDGANNQVGNTAYRAEIPMRLVVTAANDAPTLALSTGSVTIPQAGISAPITAIVRDVDLSDADRTTIDLVASSSNPNVVASSNVFFIFGGSGTPGTNTVRIVPSGAAIGNATITITAHDDAGGVSTAQTINVTVTPIAQPTFGNTNAIPLESTSNTQPSTLYPSIVNVSNVVGEVGSIVVSLIDVEHTNPDDIGVLLVSPGGQEIVLMRAAGDGTDVNDIRLTFLEGASPITDEGTLTISTNSPADHLGTSVAFPGDAPAPPYSTDLATLRNTQPNGQWRLYVYDATGNNGGGTIRGGWVLSISPTPFIDTVANRTVEEGNAATPQGVVPIVQALVNSITVPVTFSDTDGTVTNITTTVSPGGILTVGNGNITIPSGTTSANIVLNTVGDANGPVTVTVTAKDTSGFTYSRSFTVTVTPVNDPPRQEVIPRQITPAGTPVGPVPFDISDVETTDETQLIVTATSDNTKLLPPGSIVLGSDAEGDTRTITLFPAGTVAGSANVTVTVTDPEGRSSTQTFLFNATEAPNPLFEQTTQIAIRDNNTAQPYPSVITVNGLVGDIAEIQVTLIGVTHPNPDDIDVMLVSPAGKRVILMSDVGSSTRPITNVVLQFDDSAPTFLPDEGQIVSGIFKPTEEPGGTGNDFPDVGTAGSSLAVNVNDNPNGAWSLYVRDDVASSGAGGTINQWSLSIRTRAEIGEIGDAGTPGVVTTSEDTDKTISVIIGDPQPGVDFDIDVQTIAGSPAVLDDFSFTLSGNRLILTLEPLADVFGTNTLRLVVTDPDSVSTSKDFEFRVVSVNDAPRISDIANRSTSAAQPTSVTFTVTEPANEGGGSISTTATSSDQRIVPNGNLRIVPSTGTASSRELFIVPAGLESGKTIITVTATDSTGRSSTESFELTVNASVGGINPSRIIIPHFGAASPYPSVINVSGINGTVNDVRVILDGFTHTFPDDVDVLLVAPTGQRIVLMSDAGGGSDANNLRLTFAAAGSTLPDETALTSDTYIPADWADTLGGNDLFPAPAPANPSSPTAENPAYTTGPAALDALEGKNPNGDWQLFVRDDTTSESGEITRGWILVLQTGPIFVTDIADVTMDEDTTRNVAFTVADQDSPASAVNVSILSITPYNAPGLLTTENTKLTKDGFNWNIEIDPTSNVPAALGTTVSNLVTLRVTDGTGTTDQSFVVFVRAVDDAPTVTTPTPTFTINEDSTVTVDYTVRDIDSVLRRQDIVITSSNPALLPVNNDRVTIAGPTTVAAGSDGVFNVTYRPLTNANGQTVITFAIRDNNGAGSTASTNVTLNVTAVNDAPVIGDLSPSPTLEAGTTRTFAFTVTDQADESRSDNIAVSVTSGDSSIIPQSSIVLGGSGANRTVTITAIRSGTAPLIITATDDANPPLTTTRTFNVNVTESILRVHTVQTPVSIQDNGTTASVITVPSTVGVLQSLEVVLDGFEHDFPDDVDILLVSPTGDKVVLVSDVGGGNPVSGVRLTISDSGASLPNDGPITTGTYRPTNFNSEGTNDVWGAGAPAGPYQDEIADFLGDNPSGNWTLYINDDRIGGGNGQLEFGWSLRFVVRPTITLVQSSLSEGTYERWLEDSVGSISFTIDDQVTPASALEILLSSTRPDVLPVENIRLDRSGGNTIVADLRSAPNAFGTNRLTITVRRPTDGSTSSITVPMFVEPVPDLPTISSVGNFTTPEDTSRTIEVTVNDPDTARSDIDLVATSSNEAVISSTNIVILGPNNIRTNSLLTGLPDNPVRIIVQPNANASGTAQITLAASTSESATPTTRTFTVTVSAVNDAPIVTVPVPPISVEAGTTTTAIPVNVSDVEGAVVTVVGTSSDTNLVRDADIVIEPASSTGNRTMRITARPDVNGVTRITLTATDAQGATSTFTFNLNVRPPRERLFSNNTPIEIRDAQATGTPAPVSASPYPSTVNVSGFVGNISRVTVTLHGFQHSFPDDVDMLLVSPSGQKVVFWSDVGGGSAVSGLNIKLADNAEDPLPDTGQLAAGNYQPANNEATADAFPSPAPAGPYTNSTFAAFNGESPNGTWSLYIVDDTQSDSGRITNGWTLGITTAPLLTLGQTTLTTREDVETGMTFTIRDESFGDPNFTFDYTSTNETLVPSGSTNVVVTHRDGETYELVVFPEPNRSGQTRITLLAENIDGQQVAAEFDLIVEAVNDAPVIDADVPNQTLVAGTSVVIPDFDYGDVETAKGDLTVTVTSSDPAVIPTRNVVISGNTLRISSFGAATGTSRITIRVADPQGQASEINFTVTVTPAQAPQFANTQTIDIPVSGNATVYPSTITVSDVAGTVTSVTVTLAEVSHTFPDDIDVALVGPGGQRAILMSDAGGGDDLNQVRLIFADGAPALPDTTAIASGTYSPSNYDAASDTFPSPGPGSIPPGNTPLSVFAGTNPNGVWSLYVVDDGAPDGGSILNGWIINIQTTAPTLSFIPNVVIPEDVSTNIAIRVDDGNTAGNNLQVTATVTGQNGGSPVTVVAVSGTGNDRVLTIIPRPNESGTDTVTVTATDGSNTATRTFTVTVQPVGDAPLIIGLPAGPVEVAANRSLTTDFNVVDVDGDAVSVGVSSSNPDAGTVTLTGTGLSRTLSFRASGLNPASTTIRVTATDGTLTTTNSFVVNVVAPIAPTITVSALPPGGFPEDASIQIPFTVTSATSNLTVTASAGNSALVSSLAVTGEGQNRVLAIALVPNATGTSPIQIVATDADGSSTNQFTLTVVESEPDAPVLGEIPNQTIPSNVTEHPVVVTVSDPDTALEDLTFFSATTDSSIISDVRFTLGANNTVVITLIPTGTNGTASIQISVSDGENVTRRIFTATVFTPQPLTLGPIADLTVPAGTTATNIGLNVSGGLVSLSNLVFSSATAAGSVVQDIVFLVSDEGAVARVTLLPNASGSQAVQISVSDGETVQRQTFTISVQSGPGAQPEIGNITRTGTNVSFTVSGTPGAGYVVEGTADFINWSPVSTITIPAGGSATVTVPANQHHLFFRARPAGTVAAAPAALVYEGFDYAAGTEVSTNLSGGTGWADAWIPDVEGPATGHAVTNQNLSYTDAAGRALITSGNAAFYTATNASGDIRSFRLLQAARTNGTTWISFLAFRTGPTVTNTGTPNNIYPRAANLSFYNVGSERFAIGNGSGAVSNLWTVLPTGSVGATTNAQRSSVPMNRASLIVVRVDHIGDSTVNDNLYMWVNPSLGSEPSTATASASSVGAFDFSFDRIRPFVGATDSGNNRPYAELGFDEIRIGTSFASVTPHRIDATRAGDPVVLVNGQNDSDTAAGAPPAAEGVERAIDNAGQKYLNFLDFNSGLIVTPSLGLVVVDGLRLWTANDAVERDPTSYRLEGSTAGPDGPWTLISEGPLALPLGRNPGGTGALTGGNFQVVNFPNTTAYTSYRLIFPTIRDAASQQGNSMQISEIEFLGNPL